MMTAATVLFWIGTAFVLIAFGCAIAMNFTKDKAHNVLNWITIGTTLGAFVCYVLCKAFGWPY